MNKKLKYFIILVVLVTVFSFITIWVKDIKKNSSNNKNYNLTTEFVIQEKWEDATDTANKITNNELKKEALTFVSLNQRYKYLNSQDKSYKDLLRILNDNIIDYQNKPHKADLGDMQKEVEEKLLKAMAEFKLKEFDDFMVLINNYNYKDAGAMAFERRSKDKNWEMLWYFASFMEDEDKQNSFTLSFMNPYYSGPLSDEIKDIIYNNVSIKQWESQYKGMQGFQKHNYKPAIGMTKEKVENSIWGTPIDINITTTAYGVSEQWVYSIDRYVYFEDGEVTAIQE